MRVYPPVPFNARVANKDTILPHGGGADGESNVLVQKGQIVFSQHGPPIGAPDRLVMTRTSFARKDGNTSKARRWASFHSVVDRESALDVSMTFTYLPVWVLRACTDRF